jgi:hypothetical protein
MDGFFKMLGRDGKFVGKVNHIIISILTGKAEKYVERIENYEELLFSTEDVSET